MRAALIAVMMLSPLVADAQTSQALQPIGAALDEAHRHASSLAEHAATAPVMFLKLATDDEQQARTALIDAYAALTDVEHHSPWALNREAGIALLTAMNEAYAALSEYDQARKSSDRAGMRETAVTAVDRLGRALAILDEQQPIRLR